MSQHYLVKCRRLSSVRATCRVITRDSLGNYSYSEHDKTLSHELVVGDVKSAQSVEIVEILGKCLDLVGGHVEHLERAQLPYVWHELFDLVRMHVQGDQQLYANQLTVSIV